MKVGDLVRFHRFPENGYGIILSVASVGVRVYWVGGEVESNWKIHLEIVNGR